MFKAIKFINICVIVMIIISMSSIHYALCDNSALRNRLADTARIKEAIVVNAYGDEYPYPTPPFIGDDVTGQLQLANALSQQGYEPVIPIGQFTGLPKDRVSVVSLDTRTASAEDTYQKTKNFMQSVKCERNLIPFRMDSSFRGYWAKGLEAVIEETNPDIIIIAPALPDENRFTKDGMYYETSPLNHHKVTSSPEILKDIHSLPGQKDDLANILRFQLKRDDIEIVNLKSSMTEHEILNELGKCKKGAFIIFDVESHEELTKLSAFIAEYSKNKKVIACGSSGLIKEVIKQVYPKISRADVVQNWKDMIKVSFQKKNTLIVAGSITKTVLEQIEMAKTALKGDVVEVHLNVNHILNPDTIDDEIMSARRLVKKYLDKEKIVILRTTYPAQENLSSEDKLLIARSLARVTAEKDLLKSLALLTVLGGDTSGELMRELGVRNLLPKQEVSKLVPITYLEGGMLEHVPVIIKAGNIGNNMILSDIVRAFSEKKEAFLKKDAVKIGITLGDPASAAPEMVARFFLEFQQSTMGTVPIVIGHRRFLERAIEVVRKNNPQLDRVRLNIKVVSEDDISDIKYEPNTIYVYEPKVSDLEEHQIVLGKPNAMSGHAAIAYVRSASKLVKNNVLNGMVNAPISKEATDEALKAGMDSDWPGEGHSEALESDKYIGVKDGKTTTMVMAGKGDGKKMFLLQHHETTWKAFENLEHSEIVEKLLKVIRLANKTLIEQFGISNPRIALPGPNPHSGSGASGIGKFDTKAEANIRMAVKTAKEEGINIDGPISQNTAFPRLLDGTYDVVIALEHETGHLAAGLMAMAEGAAYPGVIYTITLGLLGDVIRGTVLHGSAEDIAGQGIAKADALNGSFTAVRNMAIVRSL